MFLNHEQRAALNQVAKSHGWDKMTVAEMAVLAWSAFHYYAIRLSLPSSNRSGEPTP